MVHNQNGVSKGMLAVLGLLAGILSVADVAQAQNQFGGQDRADAAAKMIVLGVQQGISSLPPTSGQSFTYEFNPALDTYVASERLGPTSFRSPQTIGAGKYSLRLATSYFELADSFSTIPYLVTDPPGVPIGAALLGLRADAHVGLINLSLNRGFTDRFEMSINLPVVVVDASATQIFSSSTTTRSRPARQAPLSGPGIRIDPISGKPDINRTLMDVGPALSPGGGLFLREESFRGLGFKFNSENHLGIGRISIGGKALLLSTRIVQLAFAPEIFLPSPSEGSFAGSETGAILPRLVAAFSLTDFMKLHVDAGYDYDFEIDQLRRIVWDFGPSFAFKWVNLDFGVGGSKFNSGIKWTPNEAPFTDPNGNPGTIQALGDNKLGDNFIDALGGLKLRLSDKSVLSLSVTVPLNNEGFRAEAVGTLAAETYF